MGITKQKKVTTLFSKRLIIFLFCALFLTFVTSVILITSSYFSDTTSGSTVVVFGEIKINANIIDEDGLNLGSNSLMAGSVIEKTLKISVPEESENCYLRMHINFQINNVEKDFLVFSIKEGTSTSTNYCADKFSVGTDNKIYLNSYISNSDGEILIPIKFVVSENFGNEGDNIELSNKNYKLTLNVEVVQSANDGYKAWQSTMPTGWPVAR